MTKPTKAKKHPAAAQLPASFRRAAEKNAMDAHRAGQHSLYAPAKHPPGVEPSGGGMAMDGALTAATQWAGGGGAPYASASLPGGQFGFLGFPYLSQIALIPEIRQIYETIGTSATEKWIRLQAKSEGGDKSKKIAELTEELERLDVQAKFNQISRQDSIFGRSHLFLDTGDNDDKPELLTSIGNGRDAATIAKFNKGSLKAIRTVEATWVYPLAYNTTDPLGGSWYKPQTWGVFGKEVDESRILTFIARPVPDLLKPAYSFGGQSMSTIVLNYVQNWLQTQKTVNRATQRFSTTVLSVNMAQLLAKDGDLEARVAGYNQYANNEGVFLLNKDTEEFQIATMSLAGLELLQAQAQEHMCLSGDTLIETARGQVPITEVTASDFVMTREGFAPVEWVGCTGYAKEIVQISTASSVLKVTPSHTIFSPETNEFVAARNVRLSQSLRKSRAWESTVSQSRGADVFGVAPKAAISAIRKAADSFIASCGKFTEAIYLTASSFTTKMKTEPTIAFQTLNSSPGQSTRPCIYKADGSDSISLSGCSSATVSFAAKVLSRARSLIRQSIARNDATHEHGRCAILSIDVVREPQPVYNISVKEGFLPEFYANGILVHNCAISRIPKVKLLGIDPAGLNASSDGELQSYDSMIGSYQKQFFSPNLTRLIDFAMINIWGDVDEDITFSFEPLEPMNEKEQAEVQLIKAQTGTVLIDAGAVSQEEERKRVATDPASAYPGLDVEDLPDLEEEEAGGLVIKGGKGQSGGGEGGGGSVAEAA